MTYTRLFSWRRARAASLAGLILSVAGMAISSHALAGWTVYYPNNNKCFADMTLPKQCEAGPGLMCPPWPASVTTWYCSGYLTPGGCQQTMVWTDSCTVTSLGSCGTRMNCFSGTAWTGPNPPAGFCGGGPQNCW